MDPLEQVARAVVAATGPGRDDLVLRATSHPHGDFSWRLSGAEQHRVRFSFDLLAALSEHFGRAVALEVRIAPDRSYDAVVATGVEQETDHLPPTYRCVVDPDFRPAPPPSPPPALPPSGDPARIPGLARALRATGPPATERELAALEAELGVVLPADLRAFHLHATGSVLCPPDDSLRAHRHLTEVDDVLAADPASWDAVPHYVGPEGAVRRMRWNRAWVPIAEVADGRHLAVDLDPGPRGRPGQVIEVDARDAPVRFVAPSVTEHLEDVLAGRYDPAGEAPPTQLSASLGATDPASLIASLDRPELVQEVVLRNVGDADLRPLDELPALRALELHQGGSVRLGRLPALERLTAHTAAAVDLSSLAGHRALRALAIDGGVLPDLPELVVFSAADPAVGPLPAAKSLSLHADRWRRLPGPPDGLAAAGLLGQDSLARAVAWARLLGAAATAERVRGRVS